MTQRDYVCLGCSTMLETKMDKCPNCGSTNVKKIDVRIEKVVRIGTVAGIKVREKIGKAPVAESVTKQEVGRDGKEAKVSWNVDRRIGTWHHEVKKLNENGNWATTHLEDETLEEHNKKKRQNKIEKQ